MLFLLIKELANDADNSFAAANSLLKAMSSNEREDQKANAIRTLQKITDVSTFVCVNRLLYSLLNDSL